MTDLLLLLLPVAAASGWYAAKRSMGRRSGGERPARTESEGLGQLLGDTSDGTLQTFVDLLQSEGDEVEMHLLLGGLFRRRGEVDRAIRVHQNLIARPALDEVQRSRALRELGQDYMKAGLLDRAESIFSSLVGRNALVETALRSLVDIYQRENEWERAIETAEQLQRRTREPQKRFIAHCYCELAEQAVRQRDFRAAGEQLRKARRRDGRCARVGLIGGRLALERKDHRSALKEFQRVAKLDPALIPEVLDPLIHCYRGLGDIGGLERYLEALHREHADVEALVIALANARDEAGDSPGARSLLLDFVRRRPSIGAMVRLAGHEPDAQAIEVLRNGLEALRSGLAAYRCTACGFSGHRIHWQCPGCRRWDTVRPLTSYGCTV